MSKKELTNQLKKAYKSLEEEFKNKGRPNTIEDNNVDYDNCNIYAMLQKIATLEKQLADSEAQNKRVLEKLELIVRSNQELEKELAEKEKTTIEKVFDVINKKYNWLGWIEDVEFDEFKENVLAELAKEKKGEQ